MNIFLKGLTSLLLVFNGIGAIYGGANLILHPDGSSMQMSLDWLKYSPFHDYFIPGIILFVANGVFSIFVLICALVNQRNYPMLVMAQGAILVGWIIIQIILIQTIIFLHWIMGAVGFALIILGGIQKITTHAKS